MKGQFRHKGAFSGYYHQNPIPLTELQLKISENVLAPFGRNLRNNPVQCDGGGNPLKELPKKEIKYCFNMQTVNWDVEVKHQSPNKYLNGQLQTITFASGAVERKFKEEFADQYLFL